MSVTKKPRVCETQNAVWSVTNLDIVDIVNELWRENIAALVVSETENMESHGLKCLSEFWVFNER